MEDFKKIMVGDQLVGILGLQKAMVEVRQLCGGESDDRTGPLLLAKLGDTNYIARGNEQVYEQAFLREYRKFTGQAMPEEARRGLTVRVLGQGCPLCRRLSNEIMQIVAESGIVCDFEHVTDLQEIARHGVFATPALIINDQVKAAGNIPAKEKLRAWLREASRSR